MSQSDKSTTQILLSSTMASILVGTLTNPLDVIKVRIQANAKDCNTVKPSDCVNHHHSHTNPVHNHSHIGKASIYRLLVTPNLQQSYNILCDCLPFRSNTKSLIYLTRKEGIRTLGKGLTQSLFMSISGTIIYFSCYEKVRMTAKKYTSDPVALPLISALSARTITTCIGFPFEYMRTLQQSTVGGDKKPSFSLGSKFGSGFFSLLQRDLLFSGLYWVLAENIRRNVKGIFQDKDAGYANKKYLILSNILAGGLSGATAASVTIPFDVVKTRKQLKPQEYSNKSTFSIMRNIYQNEGFAALFAGMRQRVTKVTMSCAGMLTLYEFFIDILKMN